MIACQRLSFALQRGLQLGFRRQLSSSLIFPQSFKRVEKLAIRTPRPSIQLGCLMQTRWKSSDAQKNSSPDTVGQTIKLSPSDKNSSGFQDIARLLRLARPEVWYIMGALCLIVVSSTVSMLVPSVIGKLLDLAKSSSPSENEKPESSDDDDKDKEEGTIYGFSPKQFCFVMCGVFVAGALANCGRIIILKITGERLVARLRTRTMKAALDQDAAFLDKNRVGDLISRLSSDASIVAKSVTQNVSDGTRAVIQGFVGFGMMTYISWQLTCVMGLMLPPIGAMAIVYGKKIRGLSKQLQTSVGGLTKVAEEQLGATKTIQSYVGEKKEIRRYAKEVRHVFDIGLKEALVSGMFFGSTGFVGNLSLLALLMSGASMIQSGAMTVGDLSSFMMYAVYTGSSLFGLSNFYSELMKGAGAASRVFELNDRKPAIAPTLGEGPASIRNLPISFKDVSFTYPTRLNKKIFDHFNLTIQPGEHICIAGPSGGGKSTIASLLVRYYDVDQGGIFIGDKDLRSFNLRKYRHLLSVVHQEPVLFNGTIRENILYAVPPSIAQDEQRVTAAIGKANCSKFLKNFPDGLETLVGPRGAQLSGGQKQRVALARAFLLDPALLVLDEATSALDSQSEEVVARTLQNRVDNGLTTISIAHRVSTIAHSTRVVVLGKDGSVVESGPFQELIARPDSELNHLLSLQHDETDDTRGQSSNTSPQTDVRH